jgi:hypothetical protein
MYWLNTSHNRNKLMLFLLLGLALTGCNKNTGKEPSGSVRFTSGTGGLR